jgi:hypothetical protein
MLGLVDYLWVTFTEIQDFIFCDIYPFAMSIVLNNDNDASYIYFIYDRCDLGTF